MFTFQPNVELFPNTWCRYTYFCCWYWHTYMGQLYRVLWFKFNFASNTGNSILLWLKNLSWLVIILNCASFEYFLGFNRGTCVFVNCISQKKCGSGLPLKRETAPRVAAQKMDCPLLWMDKIDPHTVVTKNFKSNNKSKTKKYPEYPFRHTNKLSIQHIYW